MMLKSQDVVVLLKILSCPEKYSTWSQAQLSVHLCISASEINAAIKRLNAAGLLRTITPSKNLPISASRPLYLPVTQSCEEFLIYGVKYAFSVQLGEHTLGIATSYAAPIFDKQILIGDDPIPIWPFAEGDRRGLTLKPLYPSVPKSIHQYPDQAFYDLLVLVDAIRQGRARERNIATKLLKERLNNAKKRSSN